MFNFFKKDKVRILCIDEAFVNAWPPIYSKDLKRDFLSKANEYYKKDIKREKDPTCPFAKIRNTAKCPGIRDIVNAGYIIRLHKDIRIITNGDGTTLKCETLIDSSDKKDFGFFNQDQYANFVKTSENSVKTVLKINTPWIFDHKEYCFLQTQPSFFGECRFTVIEGILDPLNSREINIIMFWNVLDGVEILRAGTPISQLIPIKRKFLPKLEIEYDHKNLRQKLINYGTFNNSVNHDYLKVDTFINPKH
jgi:hypothetical protein